MTTRFLPERYSQRIASESNRKAKAGAKVSGTRPASGKQFSNQGRSSAAVLWEFAPCITCISFRTRPEIRPGALSGMTIAQPAEAWWAPRSTSRARRRMSVEHHVHYGVEAAAIAGAAIEWSGAVGMAIGLMSFNRMNSGCCRGNLVERSSLTASFRGCRAPSSALSGAAWR
jgi:hypothetical protein